MKEKQQLLQQETTRPAPRKRQHGTFGLAVLLLITLAAFSYRSPLSTTWSPLGRVRESSGCSSEQFSWEHATSKPYLDYKPCFESFQCALLELPMDYWNGTTNATIELAVVRRPAAVPITHPQYGGPVLLNPGGPGGSGVGFAIGAAEKISKMIDSENGKYFDIISFDPRGVGFTRPPVSCYEDSFLGQSFFLRVMEEGILGSSDASFGRLWSMAIARSASCSLPPKEGEADLKKYVNTAFVARDMVELVEAHGAWREEEAERLLKSHCRHSRKRVEVPEALKHKKGEERINYWGFSYGSYLGLTFAAMFPERVERLIVDGVVDTYDYRKTLWYDNLVDTEKDLDLLYFHCARVGYPACALANSTGNTTAEGVKQRVANITTSLYHNPLPIISTIAPEVIQYSDIRALLFNMLYSPVQMFPYVAHLLAQIEKGDGTELANILRAWHRFSCSGKGFLEPPDAQMAIACTDGDDQSWVDRKAFEEHFEKLNKLSPAGGAIWATVRMQCVQFSVRPHYRFTDKFEGNTSHPILLLGNTADPVTPLIDAINLAKGYTGAVALTQDSPGHCTLSAASNCTTSYVRRYFQTGELPPKNTTCAVEQVPFGALSEQMREMNEDMAVVNAALYASGGGYFGSRAIMGGDAYF